MNDLTDTPLTDAAEKACNDEHGYHHLVDDEFARDLERALRDLLLATTAKAAPDTTQPIMWSGSPDQNRAMYKAICEARRVLKT
jgi:hypothetical protein